MNITTQEFLPWLIFNLFILFMLFLDLKVFNRKAHEIKMKEAIFWTIFWFALALVFNVGVYIFRGQEAAGIFFAGYLLERALSMDNLFVFLLIFNYFAVPSKYQHKVLFYGILGALIFRAMFIFAGIALIEKFHWLTYILGAFLVFTGFKLLKEEDRKVEPHKNPVIKILHKIFPVTSHFEGEALFVRKENRLWMTPLFVVLVFIELSDVVFAVDSIPAILAITKDPFIVYTSNVFAILGLRALYFALAGLMKLFHRLNVGLAIILAYVGVKMIIAPWVHVPVSWSLLVIVGVLALSILFSITHPQKE